MKCVDSSSIKTRDKSHLRAECCYEVLPIDIWTRKLDRLVRKQDTSAIEDEDVRRSVSLGFSFEYPYINLLMMKRRRMEETLTSTPEG